MELTEKLLTELQRRLKIGNRRGVHLNAIPSKSIYKFDLNRLSQIDKNLPNKEGYFSRTILGILNWFNRLESVIPTGPLPIIQTLVYIIEP